jgi:hypothetical protein
MKFFKDIPSNLIDKLNIPSKVAIVGNSNELLKNDYGKLIDEYSYVIRFNRSPTEGFEKIVGSKTSLRVFNEQFFMNKSNDFKGKESEKFNFDYINKTTHNANLLILYLSNLDNLKNKNLFSKTNKINYINSSINHKLKYHLVSNFNFFKKLKFYLHNSDLTSGAFILCLLVYFNYKPDVFGFNFNKNNENYSMYYSSILEQPVAHDFNNENYLLERIKNKNRAKFY